MRYGYFAPHLTFHPSSGNVPHGIRDHFLDPRLRGFFLNGSGGVRVFLCTGLHLSLAMVKLAN